MANPNYPGQQNQPAYVPAPPTNGMAIAALVGALLFAPLGIILGHIARSQIKRTGEGGRGLATAGLIIGYIFTIIPLLAAVVAVVILVFVSTDDHPSQVPPTITVPSSAFYPMPTP